ncbi:MAG: hypothetical protein JO139_00480 [Alphaproteobacteria bacterium]|nr:hypothetical protein [Alphaproteobacteria bacterium]MBV8335863.1 hypothetical protein [Alphaproteobacteria bacterium]
MQIDPTETSPSKLRELASWYRDFAERAGNPMIWEARLRTAKELEAEADLVWSGLKRDAAQITTVKRNEDAVWYRETARGLAASAERSAHSCQ